MNKLVKIFKNNELEIVVKIDTETAKTLKEGETNAFEIDGGLIGGLDKTNNIVYVSTPVINVIKNGDFKAFKEGLLNVQLNKKQTSELLKNGVLNGVSFVEIQGVKWTITLDKETKLIKAVSDFESVGLGYYTETNTLIK